MQATLGIDAATMERASTKLKNLVGRAAVLASWLETSWTYDYPDVEFIADGVTGNATFVAACNISFYGGPFQLAPEASFSSRRLHLVTFSGAGGIDTSRFVFNLLLGRHLEMDGVDCKPLDELILQAPLSAPLQLDGDVIELEAPLTIRLAPERILLLKPPADAN
jgi:diacylglycerol kinase family enzyme